jgi:hypothetical protein
MGILGMVDARVVDDKGKHTLWKERTVRAICVESADEQWETDCETDGDD